VLIRDLTIIIVLSLSFTTTINLLGDYSIIIPERSIIGLSVVNYSLEVDLSSLEDVCISYSVTYYSNSIVILAKGAIN
jgi:hypothetical protein